MAGARQRAEALVRMARNRKEPWRYFVGLEGGLDVVQDGEHRNVFLQSWAYVTDDTGRGSFGQSGAVPVPEALVERVEQGVELAKAIDDYAGGRDIRDSQGSWGILTRNLITRQDSFRVAVINAFAPFYNSEIYQAESKRVHRG